ncbi:methyl-accepting chemotaxis protein III [Salmonella enterica subsp. enterica serovar Heidelberg str. RI-11-014316]|nr:methyl-accepting chemotaxis protein III [Salmonella enterica subsp. enterica serovar Heidelberg str. RI-11-014316]
MIGASVSLIEQGSEEVIAAGSTMNEIVDAVKRVTDIMLDIAAASDEQSRGIVQVSQAISEMDRVTQTKTRRWSKRRPRRPLRLKNRPPA